MIVNAITEEKVAKLSQSESEIESTILSVLNESLLDDEQFNLSFTRDDAKEFVQEIQEEIKKYALRLAGKDKCMRFFTEGDMDCNGIVALESSSI